MTTSTLEFDEHLTIGLSRQAHEYAKGFAAEQQTVTKGKRVYLDTLAVYALHTYLKSVRIPTDLESSHSWHPISRARLDRADLFLPGIGRIECCPVLPGESQFDLTALSNDTVAYVAVQFHNELTEVELLGYQPSLETETGEIRPIETGSLYPFENFTDFLFRIYDALEYIENNPDDPDIQKLQALAEAGHSINSIVTRLEFNRTKDPLLVEIEAKEILGLEEERVPVSAQKKTREALNLPEDVDEDEEEEALGELAVNLLAKFNQFWED